MKRRIEIPMLSSGMAIAALAATMIGGPTIGIERPQSRFRAQKKRKTTKAADRSKKQYLIKGVRP